MQNGAQAVGHNDGVTVRQCAIEEPLVQNGAQALDSSFRQWGWAGKRTLPIASRRAPGKGAALFSALSGSPVARGVADFCLPNPIAGERPFSAVVPQTE